MGCDANMMVEKVGLHWKVAMTCRIAYIVLVAQFVKQKLESASSVKKPWGYVLLY